MPITKSAIKKQRVDRKRVRVNEPVRGKVKVAIKEAKSNPTNESIATFYAAVDRAVAKKLVSPRTAARMKSRLVKMARAKLPKSPFGKAK